MIVRGTSEDDAKALVEEVLPKLTNLLPGKSDKQLVTEIGGQKIFSLPTGGKNRVYYGRQGDTIVLGPDLKLVAAWLKNSGKKDGLLADEKVAAEVKKLNEPVALAVAKPVMLAGWFFLFRSSSAPPQAEPATRPDEAASPPDKPRPQRRLRQKPDAVPASAASNEQEGMVKMLETLEKDGLLLIGLTRKPDHVQIEARYTGLRKLVPALHRSRDHREFSAQTTQACSTTRHQAQCQRGASTRSAASAIQ